VPRIAVVGLGVADVRVYHPVKINRSNEQVPAAG
jgi:hypothetical protein